MGTVSGWYVDVEIETFFALTLEERSESLDVVSSRWCLSGLIVWSLRRRRELRADWAVAECHADSIPLLGRARRRHETQLAAQKRGVLQTEIRLHERQPPVAECYEDTSQFPVLGLDHPRAHLGRKHLAADCRPELTQDGSGQHNGCWEETMWKGATTTHHHRHRSRFTSFTRFTLRHPPTHTADDRARHGAKSSSQSTADSHFPEIHIFTPSLLTPTTTSTWRCDAN